MNNNFAFDNYTVRAVTEGDREFITERLAKDQYHIGTDADYFLHLVPGEDAWAVENPQGQVVLYFKTKVVCRLAMLFGNQGSNENREVLSKGVDWLADMLAHNRFRELIFDTEGPALRAAAKRRLGFTEGPGVLVRYLPAPGIDESLATLWNHGPQASQDMGVGANVRE